MVSPSRPRASPQRRPLHERSDSQTNKIRPILDGDHEPYDDDDTSSPSHGPKQLAEPHNVSDNEPFSYQHQISRPPLTSTINSSHLTRRWSDRSEQVLTHQPDTTIYHSEIDYNTAPPQHQNTGPVAWRPSESTSSFTPSGTSVLSLDGRFTLRPNASRPSQPSRLSHRISVIDAEVPSSDKSDIDPHAAHGPVSARVRHHPLESRFSITRPEADQTDQTASLSEAAADQMPADHATRYKQTSYSAFPSITASNYAKAPLPPLPPSSSRSNLSTPSPTPQSRPPPGRRRPAQTKSQRAAAANATLQYPVVKPPSSQSSWAESSVATPERAWTKDDSPAHDQQWVAGGFPKADSAELELDSKGESRGDFDLPRSRRRTGSSSMMVGIAVTSGPEESSPPNSSGQRNIRSSTIRVVSEGHAYNSSRISSQRASDFRISSLPDKLPDPSRQSIGGIAQGEPVIRPSVLAISLPDWARTYYSRGANESVFDALQDASRPGTSTHYYTTQHNPTEPSSRRNRPPNIDVITPERAVLRQDMPYRGSMRRPMTDVWSPHLQPDCRARPRSIWMPPQYAERPPNGLLNKRRLQLGLFCLGFIFPFAWMIGALLRLPPNPRPYRKSRITSTPVEEVFDKNFYAVDEARYDSARWWRNINRVMSVFGLMIIGVVIALGVVGARSGGS